MAVPLPIHTLIHQDDLPITWLIPDFMPTGSLILLGGEAGTGKSYFAYMISLALSTATPLLNWPACGPYKVLYFDQENSQGDAIQYWRWAWHALDCPSLSLVEQNLTFYHFALSGTWAKQMAIAVTAYQPQVVVIDTATPSCQIIDENDNGEASRVIMILRHLQTLITPSPVLLVLKHARLLHTKNRGENPHYTLRGAKAWEGMADSILFQLRRPGHPRTDDLKNTRIIPAKIRAFGLRHGFDLIPQWNATGKGLQLTAVPLHSVRLPLSK